MKSGHAELSIPSPCVRNCCLDGQDVCIGCFRTYEEILEWSGASEQRKQEILARASERRLHHKPYPWASKQ
ncbi:DUF1289 domain-containing protein [Litoribrevibacter euphylliae]|uniref:DUF1289 domain-containing protein n=1 Tax=Litoribrevibacter euphylliae TaxID=1834034 RepID=A0ABV7HH21_9GAMM